VDSTRSGLRFGFDVLERLRGSVLTVSKIKRALQWRQVFHGSHFLSNLRRLAAFACAPFLVASINAQNQSPINVGVVMTLSSFQGNTGVNFVRGASSCVKAINKSGGVRGRVINLIVENDEGGPENAIALVDDLLKQNVVALVGGSGELVTRAIAERGRKSGVALVGGLAAQAELRRQFAANLVTTRVDDSRLGAVFAAQLNIMHLSRVAIIAGRDAASVSRVRNLQAVLNAAGVKTVTHLELGDTTIEAQSVLPALNAMKADAALVLTGYEATANLIKASNSGSQRVVYFVTNDVGSSALAALTGKDIKGVGLLSATPIAADNRSAIAQETRRAMAASYPDQPIDEIVLEGCIAATLVAEAIKKTSGAITAASVRTALMSDALRVGEISFRQAAGGTQLSIPANLAIFNAAGKLIY
jgi:branched-chain amino acid transport system substrate-binding protein